MKKKLLFIFLSCMVMASVISAQVSVNTYGVSPRQAVADTNDIFDLVSTGIENVGVNSKVYLKGVADTNIAAATWELLSKPAGSATELGTVTDMDSVTQMNNLTPDLVGTYKVIFSNAIDADTVTINAGTYLGTPTVGMTCGMCHAEEQAKWEGTGHADMLTRAMDGSLSTHYGPNCVSCHTTGYDPNADNNGFDDRDFVYPSGPDSLNVDTWDSLLVNSPSAMELANIQCESCHGPGSEHIGQTADSKMVSSIDTKNCAVCHDSGTHHAFPTQWEASGKDATEFDGRGFHGGHAAGAFVSYAGGRGSCAPCHSGAGYIQWVKEGKPTNDDGLPTGTDVLPEAVNISCAVCHDPHDNTNLHQLRLSDTQLGDGTPVTFDQYGTGAQCMECHRSRRLAATYANDINNESSHYGPHHGPQADMLIGGNGPNYGIEFQSSPHAQATENACVDCHMAGDLTDAEGNINLVGGHSFNMNDAEGNDHVESCAPCHGNVGETFKEKKYYINGNADLDGDGTAKGLQEEVHGLLEELATFLPHNDDGAVAIVGDSTNLTPAIMRAGYVYMFIEEDRSFGIHNPAYTISMLKAAIDEMGGVTGINYADVEIPQEYQLSQNYPNPFNPTTVINFSIPKAGDVRIAVYDALGREIELLLDQSMDAGNYNADWNATNYAAGIYFYSIKVNDFTSTKKMVLLK
jgi:Secretion system C-terminal sorting domain/Cytochrome c552/Cytochrome c554 and c-prime